MSKELRVKDVKDAKKKLSNVTVVSWLAWLGSALLAPTSPIPTVLLATFGGLVIANDRLLFRLTKTVEYKRFIEIYEHIIAEYIKLNDRLEFKDVIEVFAFFTACLHSNIFSLEEPNDTISSSFEHGLLGPKVLNGHGVCRHNAKMLMDIFERMGFETTVGVCAKYDYKEKFVPSQELDKELLKAMFEDLKEKIDDPVLKTLSFDDMIVMPPVEVHQVEKPLRGIKAILGNHAITLVNDQTNSHFLDPTTKGILFPCVRSEKEFRYQNGHRVVMKPMGRLLLQDDVDFRDIARKPVLSEDEYFEKMTTALEKALCVKDEVHEFHQEILEPLREADMIYKLLLK